MRKNGNYGIILRKKIQAEKIREKIMRYKEEKHKSLGSYGIGKIFI